MLWKHALITPSKLKERNTSQREGMTNQWNPGL